MGTLHLKRAHSLRSIAKKHSKSLSYIQRQLEKGQKVEREHTTRGRVARRIAKHHLYEKHNYYNLLQKYVEDCEENNLVNRGRGFLEEDKLLQEFAIKKAVHNVVHPWKQIPRDVRHYLRGSREIKQGNRTLKIAGRLAKFHANQGQSTKHLGAAMAQGHALVKHGTLTHKRAAGSSAGRGVELGIQAASALVPVPGAHLAGMSLAKKLRTGVGRMIKKK